MKYYIGLEINSIPRHVLTVEYANDGSYYLFPPTLSGDKFLATKYKIKPFRQSTQTVKILEAWTTVYKPKISHHIDGNCHISGHQNIKSGFFRLTGKPKGLHNSSFDLRVQEVGGTVCSINAWGIENFPVLSRANSIITPENKIEASTLDIPLDKKAYVLEALYIPKAWLAAMYPEDNTVNISRKVGAKVYRAQCILPNNASPGFIAFNIFHSTVSDNADTGYHLSATPGKKDKNGEWYQISISFPAGNLDKSKSLDVTYFDKLKFKVDGWLAKLFS